MATATIVALFGEVDHNDDTLCYSHHDSALPNLEIHVSTAWRLLDTWFLPSMQPGGNRDLNSASSCPRGCSLLIWGC